MSKLDFKRTSRFIFAVSGIYVTYIYYGLLQEKIFKTTYKSTKNPKDEQKFTFTFAIILFQCILSALIGHFASTGYCKVPLGKQFKQGAFNGLSMILSNSALKFVSYPIQALFKSCKMLSVLIVALLGFGKVQYSRMQYVAGITVSIGIAAFNIFEQLGKKSSAEVDNTQQLIGLSLLLVALLSDGLLADDQNQTRLAYQPTAFQSMFYTSFYGVIITLAYSLLSREFFMFFSYSGQRPEVWVDLIQVAILGAIGQVFIFYTIENFGALTLAFVTTTRKFFTIIFSIFYYNHEISQEQWISILVVFIGISFELADSFKKKKSHSTKAN